VALLDECPDRNAAALLIGAQIAVRRDQLPATEAGEYYWADLVGLRVVTTGGVDLGRVSHLFETGANDVIVARGDRERMIPYVREHVVRVDMERGEIVVDWDPDF
jgi:16S rRNA processing protein RimM